MIRGIQFLLGIGLATSFANEPPLDIKGESELSVYVEFLSECYPRIFEDVVYSNEFLNPDTLRERSINTVQEARDYFLDAFRANRSIGSNYFPPPKSQSEKSLRGRLDGFASDCVIPSLIILRDSGQRISDMLSKMELLASSERLISNVATKQMLRRDIWQVYTSAFTDVPFVTAGPLILKRDLYTEALGAPILLLCRPIDTELKEWDESSLEAEVLNAGGQIPELKEFTEVAADAYQLPDSDLVHFSHTQAYKGASIFRVYIVAPGWSKKEVSELYEKVRKLQASGKPAKRGEIEEFPEGTKTYLVRNALLPYSIKEHQTIEVTETPLIEEVLIREFSKNHPWKGVDMEMSDFVGVRYKQYKLDRHLYVYNKGKAYLREISEDEPVFYGFRTDVPDPGRGGKFAVTMRGNCTDCHASESYGWPTVQSLVMDYRSERLQALNGRMSLQNVSSRKWRIKYISPDDFMKRIKNQEK